MTGPRTPDVERLPQVCWCDTDYRWATVDDIRNGIGWSCDDGRHCQPGCAQGAGMTPRQREQRRRRDKGTT